MTQCSIRVGSDSDSGTTYEVKVEYTYTVLGKTFTGSRLAFGYSASGGREAHQEIYRALTAAKTVDVRYDPSNPAVSALSFGFHRSIQLTLTFASMWLAFCVGFTLLWWLSSKADNVLLKNLIVR